MHSLMRPQLGSIVAAGQDLRRRRVLRPESVHWRQLGGLVGATRYPRRSASKGACKPPTGCCVLSSLCFCSEHACWRAPCRLGQSASGMAYVSSFSWATPEPVYVFANSFGHNAKTSWETVNARSSTIAEVSVALPDMALLAELKKLGVGTTARPTPTGPAAAGKPRDRPLPRAAPPRPE